MAGVACQLGCRTPGHRIEHRAFLQLAGDGSQAVPDRGRPIACRRILFGGGAVLGGAEFVRAEQRMVAAAVGAHGAASDPDSDDDRGGKQDQQHRDREPAARHRRPFGDYAIQQLVDPRGEAFGQRRLGVDRF